MESEKAHRCSRNFELANYQDFSRFSHLAVNKSSTVQSLSFRICAGGRALPIWDALSDSSIIAIEIHSIQILVGIPTALSISAAVEQLNSSSNFSRWPRRWRNEWLTLNLDHDNLLLLYSIFPTRQTRINLQYDEIKNITVLSKLRELRIPIKCSESRIIVKDNVDRMTLVEGSSTFAMVYWTHQKVIRRPGSILSKQYLRMDIIWLPMPERIEAFAISSERDKNSQSEFKHQNIKNHPID